MQIEMNSARRGPFDYRGFGRRSSRRAPKFARHRNPRGMLTGLAIAVIVSMILWVALYEIGDLIF